MWLLSMGLWLVVVYSMRVALFGNPLYRLVARADAAVLDHLDRAATVGNAVIDESSVLFLQRFSRLTLLELGAFVLEMGLLVTLWLTEKLEWLALFLFCKNLLLVALSIAMARRHADRGLFAGMLDLPAWVVRLDRVSAFVSGTGAPA